jgi:hypothetical protein
VAGLLLALAAPVSGTELLPVDEAARRPDFFSFRARLQASVASRDAKTLMDAADPRIKLSFGGDDGIDALRRQVGQPDGTFWAELGAVLALGGTFSGENAFVAPYTFSRWPEAFDSFEHVALIAADVRLREAPQADAVILSVMSFAILPLAAPDRPDAAWRAVRLAVREGRYTAAKAALLALLLAGGLLSWRLGSVRKG